jgi:hypothetical protein
LDAAGYSEVFMSVSMVAAAISYVIAMPLVEFLRKRVSKKGILFMGLTL